MDGKFPSTINGALSAKGLLLLACPDGLLTLIMIHCKLFRYHQCDNEFFSFRHNYRFYKGHPPVSTSTR